MAPSRRRFSHRPRRRDAPPVPMSPLALQRSAEPTSRDGLRRRCVRRSPGATSVRVFESRLARTSRRAPRARSPRSARQARRSKRRRPCSHSMRSHECLRRSPRLSRSRRRSPKDPAQTAQVDRRRSAAPQARPATQEQMLLRPEPRAGPSAACATAAGARGRRNPARRRSDGRRSRRTAPSSRRRRSVPPCPPQIPLRPTRPA